MDQQILNQIFWGNSVRNYLFFIGILILGFILKRLVSRLISRFLFSFFQRFSQEVRAEKFLELLLKPIEFLITIIFIYLAINQLDYPLNEVLFRRTSLENKVEKVYIITIIQVVDKLFLLLLIISAFRILLRVIDFIGHVFSYKASLTDSKTDDQMVPFLKELSKIVAIILCVFVVMGAVFNMNVATIVAGLGIGGLAIALAAQDTLQNLLGSFTIFADKPFIVGDLVKVAGYDGTIEKVGFRSTHLRTMDKTLVIIPNKTMIDSPLENQTLRNLRRVKFNIGLLYNTSAEVIQKISHEIKEVVNDHEHTNSDTIVNFDSFGDSSLNIQILYFIEIIDYAIFLSIKEDLNYKIMKIVEENHAEFAYPSSTVYHQFNDKGLKIK